MISLDELSEEEIFILEDLGTFGGKSLNDLTYTSHFDRSRLFNALQDLREDGFVRFDSSLNAYHLTSKGNHFVLEEGLVTA